MNLKIKSWKLLGIWLFYFFDYVLFLLIWFSVRLLILFLFVSIIMMFINVNLEGNIKV